MKIVFTSAFILIFFIVSCDGLTPDKDVTVDTIDNIFFQQSEDKNLSYQKRLVAIDSFLIGARNSADTLDILLGLKKKTYLLGAIRKYDLTIPFCKELLSIAIAKESKEYTRLGYDKISRYYSNLSNYDSSVYYAEKLVRLSKDISDSISIAKGYFKLGLYKKQQHKLSASFDNYSKAFLLYKSLKDSTSASSSLLNMANIQKSIGDFSGSLETATEGFKYLEGTDDVKTVFGLYQVITTAFREQKKFEKAFEYNNKAIQIISDTLNIGKIGGNNILIAKNTEANIYRDQKLYDEAIEIYHTLLLDPFVQKEEEEKARIQSNLGYTLWLKNKDNLETEGLLQEALLSKQKENDIRGLIASNIHLTQYYKYKDKNKALAYAQKALVHSKKLKSVSSIKESLGYIIDLKDNSTNEARLFKDADNELTNLRRNTQDIYAVTRFDINEKEKEILSLEINNVKTENQKILSYIVTIMIGFLATIFILFLRQKHKREKVREIVKETYETERRLSKKVHDELANDMSGVMNLIDNNLAIPDSVKVPLVNKLEDLYERTRDVSAEIDGFDNKDFAKSLKFLITQYNTDGVKVITNVTSGINWDMISDHKKINIYRSLQELLVNTKKYSNASEITVIFKTEGRKHFINYTDNGVGFEFDTVYKRGLQNVETRIKNIRGIITFNTSKGNGFKAHLYF